MVYKDEEIRDEVLPDDELSEELESESEEEGETF